MAIVGSELKRKEKLSGRLGDILSFLYLGSAVLKRFHDDGMPKEDEPLLQAACETVLYDIQQSIDAVIRNFPNRLIAGLLRCVIFPLGRRFHAPSDKLGHEIVKLLLEPSATRDRLTRGLCLSTKAHHPLGRIDEALKQVISIKSLEKKIRAADRAGEIKGANYDEMAVAALKEKLITPAEYDHLVEAHAACMEVINVDDFDPSELVRSAAKPKRSTRSRVADKAE